MELESTLGVNQAAYEAAAITISAHHAMVILIVHSVGFEPTTISF